MAIVSLQSQDCPFHPHRNRTLFINFITVKSSDINRIYTSSMQTFLFSPTPFNAWSIFYLPYTHTILVRLYPHIFIPVCWWYTPHSHPSPFNITVSTQILALSLKIKLQIISQWETVYSVITCPSGWINKFDNHSSHQTFYSLIFYPLILFGDSNS